MKSPPLTLLLSCIFISIASNSECVAHAHATASTETVIHPTIDSVGLFKNGLAVVKASFPIDGPGDYRWEEVPRVVHGSFWVESDAFVTIQSTTRLIEETSETEFPTGSLQQDLAGKRVTITRQTGHEDVTTLRGTVWDMPAPSATKTWNADYSSLQSFGNYWQLKNTQPTPPRNPSTGSFLVLKEENGQRRYIAQSSITALDVAGPFEPTTQVVEKPVLIFNVEDTPTEGARVHLTYLSKGLAWLPSYQIDLSDPKMLKIRQNAVVRNEMNDLNDTELQLISGYPNVRFGNVDSPVWHGTNLAAFFQQVNQSPNTMGGIHSNVVTQNMAYSAPSGGTSLPSIPESGNASDDIHYESIGRHSMRAGDSLSLDVASALADYERIIEWTVADPRNERGRYDSRNVVDNTVAWDAVRFNNPFKFPMTTAAAMIVESGKFRGQSQSQWVNPSQETCLRITRALSIHTETNEIEEEAERQIVYIGGNDYQRTTVKGRLFVRNYRDTAVTLAIHGEFSGKLLEADGEPETSLRTEGIPSVNPRRQLNWTLKLAAGAEKEITYRYEVLVDR